MVKKIDVQAFWGCNNLKEIDIPDSVMKIDYGAFHECNNLAKVSIPKQLKRIAKSVFPDSTVVTVRE